MQYSAARRPRAPQARAPTRRGLGHRAAPVALTLVVALLPGVLVLELRTSALQALVFARVADALTWRVGPGPSEALYVPEDGPYDRRLGHAQLPQLVRRLEPHGFRVTAQARQSPALRTALRAGLAAPYAEKARAGLVLEDARGRILLDRRHPRRTFSAFEAVPSLVVQTLLFFENRELLAPGAPLRNPAIEWDRLGRAVGLHFASVALGAPRGPGASTLATQLEKVRHSPGGRTLSPAEKLRQMLAASLRAYRDGPDTRAVRRRVVLDYLNAVPLAAAPGVGEVFGLGDGLAAWFGAELDEVVRALEQPDAPLAERARAFRQVVALLVAQRRPTDYLRRRPDALATATDRELRRLHTAGIASARLRDAALAAETPLRASASPVPPPEPRARKAVRSVRAQLGDWLDASGYALDRLDLRARTTLEAEVQARVEARLRALEEPEAARRAGLVGPRLLSGGGLDRGVVSLSLYEAGADANRLRLQLDTLPGTFNVAEGARLDLGSTAKLRTLVHYLDVVAELHARHVDRPEAALAAARAEAGGDPIARWVLARLAERPELPLDALLAASLERRYSASTGEPFFTGGAWRRFRNASDRFEGERLSVREGFRHSVNLVFVRLLRDLRRHALAEEGVDPERVLGDASLRRRYLERFVAEESRRRLAALHARHRRGDASPQGPPSDALERFARARLAAEPGLSLEALVEASGPARREAYGWLLRTRVEEARERRVRTVLEREAFRRIHERWRRHGYPFGRLVPSLATALGASSDRPAALAELLGVVANRGWRRPVRRIETLALAEGTPYETRLGPGAPRPERVLAPEVADALQALLRDAVQHGTGRRARGAFEASGPPGAWVAGKTGTSEALAPRGARRDAGAGGTRAAAFAFLLGDRHYGVLTVHARGPEAARMRFTSSLATQLLGVLAPELAPLLGGGADDGGAEPLRAQAAAAP